MVREISHRPALGARFKYFEDILKGVPITGLNFWTKVIHRKKTSRLIDLKVGKGTKMKKKRWKKKITWLPQLDKKCPLALILMKNYSGPQKAKLGGAVSRKELTPGQDLF